LSKNEKKKRTIRIVERRWERKIEKRRRRQRR
jgi:hypothetical protein